MIIYKKIYSYDNDYDDKDINDDNYFFSFFLENISQQQTIIIMIMMMYCILLLRIPAMLIYPDTINE